MSISCSDGEIVRDDVVVKRCSKTPTGPMDGPYHGSGGKVTHNTWPANAHLEFHEAESHEG